MLLSGWFSFSLSHSNEMVIIFVWFIKFDRYACNSLSIESVDCRTDSWNEIICRWQILFLFIDGANFITYFFSFEPSISGFVTVLVQRLGFCTFHLVLFNVWCWCYLNHSYDYATQPENYYSLISETLLLARRVDWTISFFKSFVS